MSIRALFCLGIFLSAMLIGGVIFWAKYDSLQETAHFQAEDLKYYKDQFKWLQGSGILTGDYRLVSLDGGKTWFSYEASMSADGKTCIGSTNLRPADPKLLDKLKALDELTNPSQQIDFSSPTDVEKFRRAGFTVTTKP